MSDRLLLASMVLRGCSAALNSVLATDAIGKARLAALTQPAAPDAARVASRELRLRLLAEPALIAGLTALDIVIADTRITLCTVDSAALDPVAEPTHAADATLCGPSTSLLRALAPARADVAATLDDRLRLEGDRAFALALLQLLRGLRPNPLLQLAALAGPQLPSALYAIATVGAGIGRELLAQLPPRGFTTSARTVAPALSTISPTTSPTTPPTTPPTTQATPRASTDEPTGAH